MINYNNPELWYDDAVHKDLLITDGVVTVSGSNYTVTGATVTITNELIEAEAFELHQSLCSEPQLRFGASEAASVSFVIHDNIPTIKGKTIKVYIIPDSDASEMIQIGVFKVAEDKMSADRTKRSITAYDALYDILNADLAGWYNNILPNSTSSVTLAQFRFALFAYLNIEVETATLANDSIIIRRTIDPETLSGADVIRAICEINGVFGKISNEGKFKFVELTAGLDDGLFPSETLYPADDLYPQDVNHDIKVLNHGYYIDVTFEDYLSEAITQLTIRTDDEDVGVTVGTNGNRYVITGNFLVFGYNATALTSVANNCLGKIGNRYYKPSTVTAVGNPLFEVGDGIRIRTTFRGIVTYILERKLSGIQALRDTYTAQGEQYYGEQLNSMTSQIKQLSGKTTKIKKDVDGVKVEVNDLDTRESSHYSQTSGQIQLKVSKDDIVSDLNAKMSGITITSDSIEVSSSGTFTVDSTNFQLDEDGKATLTNAELDSVTLTGGEIEMDEGSGLSLFHGGIAVVGTWLDINGRNSGGGSSTFWDVAINGDEVHINYQGQDTKIYNCSLITNTDTTTNSNRISMYDSGAGISLVGNEGSRISIDNTSTTYDILLDGSVNIGNGSSNTIRIKGKDVKWVTETINGTSYKILVEDA